MRTLPLDTELVPFRVVIERERVDGIAVVRLAHGPVSAMDLELCTAITETFRALADDDAQAVVLTGTGSAFSAGVDLRRILDGGVAYVDEFMPALSEVLRTAFTFGKPVVAAVNGHAIAGGCVLAASADTALMAEGKGRIGLAELQVGVAFPQVPLQVMHHAVGPVVARRLVIGAQTYDPATAKELGLVDEVVAPDELLDRAIAAAKALTKIPADTFAITKEQLRRPFVQAMDESKDEERVAEIWRRRATDGIIADYMARATGKRKN
ncbi:enoyl-CoA hydratase [Pseudonocardia thermophila]|uniref:Enoyl-CoA hydratase n=1 Tax=Pseudonocardia thermophila TaxID=1848 RepID=A0A1M6YJ52_PSETH|nr:enoyl-CoA hydratase [Pseudonocardia thermophila]